MAKKKAFLNKKQKEKHIKKNKNKQHLLVILGTLSALILTTDFWRGFHLLSQLIDQETKVQPGCHLP